MSIPVRYLAGAAGAMVIVAIVAAIFWRQAANQAPITGRSIPQDDAGRAPAAPAQKTIASGDGRSTGHDSVEPIAGPANRASNKSYGPIEASFVDEGRINQRAVDALQSQAFDSLLTRFERENIDTGELLGAYRSQLQGQLNALPQALRLDRFACGVDLCIGSIRAPKGSAEYRAWYAQLQGTSRLPIPVLTEAVVDLGDQEEHRIVFSTKPSVAGISGHGNGKSSPPR